MPPPQPIDDRFPPLAVGAVFAFLMALAAGLAALVVFGRAPTPDPTLAEGGPIQPNGSVALSAGQEVGVELASVIETVDGSFAQGRSTVEIVQAVIGLADATCATAAQFDQHTQLAAASERAWDEVTEGDLLAQLFSGRDRYRVFVEAVVRWRCPDQAARLGL